MTGKSEIRFHERDLHLFRDASHDRNPLHLSAEYSHKTPFGEPVVYGILASLTALAHLPSRPGQELAELALDFPSPLYLEIPYTVHWEAPSAMEVRFRILDGSRLMLKGVARFRLAGPPGGRDAPIAGTPRAVAACPADDQIASAAPLGGVYACASAPFSKLWESLGLDARGVTGWQTASLLWASYLIGMEMPGERALFSKLRLCFDAGCPVWGGFTYRVQPRSFDTRFSILHLDASLETSGGQGAQATLQSFVRPGSPPLQVDVLPEQGDELAGRTAFVVGGSRGLGAALVRSLGLRGATVYFSYRQSKEEADSLLRGPGAAVAAIPGDAADSDWCRQTAATLQARHGGLDLLVCNAGPALTPLRLEPQGLERIHRFLSRSVSMVSTPMANWLAQIDRRQGAVVVISSIATKQPVANWPHYIAAKHAIEGLTEVAALEYLNARFLVVRPPRLLTDLTNTPLGRHLALPPQVVANRVTHLLAGKTLAPGLHWIEDFPAPDRWE
jgi:NAD(P)-dependent dehydrogenase (short-subunit alcohol dehydrogenase family)